MKAVFYHKPDSGYKDETGIKYHFPQSYLSRVAKSLNDWIVYYGPVKGLRGRYYTGIALVKSVEPDLEHAGLHYAFLDYYIDFDRPVEYKEGGGFERRLVERSGIINQGYKVQAVRMLEDAEFATIVSAGLSTPEAWPDRNAPDYANHMDAFSESPQPEIIDAEFDRPVVELLTRRKWRDIKFRQNVRVAYDRTCAFTNLKLINGRGRPEVEAAHIRPVENGGNDWIRNGLALSGTVHWMFDRGMLSLADDLTILVSRHLNEDVSHFLNKDMKAKVPVNVAHAPHPAYLEWHRKEKFKK
ncbi:MAG: HNH endonuclease [Rhizobiales bacterium]|nr:HNH endonuclease [Hyphomicrobiales bacterium]